MGCQTPRDRLRRRRLRVPATPHHDAPAHRNPIGSDRGKLDSSLPARETATHLMGVQPVHRGEDVNEARPHQLVRHAATPIFGSHGASQRLVCVQQTPGNVRYLTSNTGVRGQPRIVRAGGNLESSEVRSSRGRDDAAGKRADISKTARRTYRAPRKQIVLSLAVFCCSIRDTTSTQEGGGGHIPMRPRPLPQPHPTPHARQAAVSNHNSAHPEVGAFECHRRSTRGFPGPPAWLRRATIGTAAAPPSRITPTAQLPFRTRLATPQESRPLGDVLTSAVLGRADEVR